ncbi:hypothetical protein [Ruegeria sp. SCP11]|uniref:aspartate racemase/maleate isomerase family protein n=1 Tax=Ruegeria sp. SCP11 TaxID=3141378 RepID=UPI0033374B6F
MDVFDPFLEAKESKVARISRSSIIDAALKLGANPLVEAVFVNCTNIITFDVVPGLEDRLNQPVLSSNQSLAWHMRRLNSA